MPIVKIVYKSYNIKRKRKVFLGRSNADIFSEIYDRKLWGKKPENISDFYSGTGSCGKPVEDYVNCINTFILDNKISSITDVGCGDFFVGGKITSCDPSLNYVGCDVVPELISRNREKFGSTNVKFEFLDASADPLPQSQLLTIRQVLQHLSNADIKAILNKSKGFPYVIITEHQYKKGLEKSFNKDKPSGPDIRLVEFSGVYLDKEPFNLEATEILRCREDSNGKEAHIVSYLIIN